MNGFAFHPEALNDLNDVWDFIAADNVDAADRIVGESLTASGRSFLSRGRAIAARI